MAFMAYDCDVVVPVIFRILVDVVKVATPSPADTTAVGIFIKHTIFCGLWDFSPVISSGYFSDLHGSWLISCWRCQFFVFQSSHTNKAITTNMKR